IETHLHAIEMRAQRDDANPEHEGRTEDRAGEHHAFASVDSVHQVPVECIQIDALADKTKGHDGELRFSHDLHPLNLPQLFGCPPRQIELLVQLQAKGLDAEKLEWQPDPQAAKVARQLRRELTEIDQPLLLLN